MWFSAEPPTFLMPNTNDDDSMSSANTQAAPLLYYNTTNDAIANWDNQPLDGTETIQTATESPNATVVKIVLATPSMHIKHSLIHHCLLGLRSHCHSNSCFHSTRHCIGWSGCPAYIRSWTNWIGGRSLIIVRLPFFVVRLQFSTERTSGK